MDFDFIGYRESEYLRPIVINRKEKYHLDIMNLLQSWTGRLGFMFANEFFREANQLIINSIKLFEMGYFDCSFYSLRQALEIATTVIYFTDENDKKERSQKFSKWKNGEKFPMHTQMLNELKDKKNVFAEMREKMSDFFEIVETTKRKLNKYLHKQGFDKFYVHRKDNPRAEDINILLNDFEKYLKVTIGTVAVLRLSIDPLPVLLADKEIYSRTMEFITEAYSDSFIDEYISKDHLDNYKKTEMFKSHYESFITQEVMLPPVLDIVKNDFIDTSKFEEIQSQIHLLSYDERVAVCLMILSFKVIKVYTGGFLQYYWNERKTNRIKQSWSSNTIKEVKEGKTKFNIVYDEVYLSHIKYKEQDYFIEHNETFQEDEIETLKIFESNAYNVS